MSRVVPLQKQGHVEMKEMFHIRFDNYKVGGILGTIMTDSETIAEDIAKSTNPS